MKVTANRNVESSTKEVVDIHIEFNPFNNEEEGYASLLMAMVDLIQRFFTLSHLGNNDSK